MSADHDTFYLEMMKRLAAAESSAEERAVLDDLLQRAKHWVDRHAVLDSLARLLSSEGEYASAEAAYRECVDLNPTVAASWIALARFYASTLCDRPKAIEAINTAVSAQCELANVFHYAHGVRISIAVILNDKELATDSLQTLIRLLSTPHAEQLEPILDFLPKLPKLGVSEQLVAEYCRVLKQTPQE